MPIFDIHQDLLSHLRFRDRFGQSYQTSFADIAVSPIELVIATAFPLPPGDNHYDITVPDLITEELLLYHEHLTTQANWRIVKSGADLLRSGQKLILHLEGLNVFDGSASAWQQLEYWESLGVRSVGTHWNIANQLGGGTLQPESPLTALGAEVITYLERNHLIFDMAHMGRQTFWDAVPYTTRPLYVSHGNADAVCPHMRNYTDDQLRAIAESDGLIGVFFANTFVAGQGRMGTIADVVAHLTYIKALIGVRHIALGSDFGGIVTGGVVGLEDVSTLASFLEFLSDYGFREDEIAAITHENARRVLLRHLS